MTFWQADLALNERSAAGPGKRSEGIKERSQRSRFSASSWAVPTLRPPRRARFDQLSCDASPPHTRARSCGARPVARTFKTGSGIRARASGIRARAYCASVRACCVELQQEVHMVSALACEHGLVLAQQPTASKSNELNAIRASLDLIDVKGSLISLDAMGCQRDVAQKKTAIAPEGKTHTSAMRLQPKIPRESHQPRVGINKLAVPLGRHVLPVVSQVSLSIRSNHGV